MSNNKYSPKDIKGLVKEQIKTNQYLVAAGKKPVAIEIIGVHGIGKSSVLEQVAEEIGANYVPVSLTQLEEVGDLVGMPIKEYCFEHKESGNMVWVDKELLPLYLGDANFTSCNRARTSYAKPAWVPDDESVVTIFNLDDSARADDRFTAATMELVNRGSYMSWDLPKNCFIFLTNNPDDGNYKVKSRDGAESSRSLAIEMRFDESSWAEWAENYGLDSRLINFALTHPEIFIGLKDGQNTKKINPRTFVKFADSISRFKDFNTNFSTIYMLGESTIGSYYLDLLRGYINRGLDKTISPKEMLTLPLATVKARIKSFTVVGKHVSKINSVMLKVRLVNYCKYMVTNNLLKKEHLKRVEEILLMDEFTADVKYSIVKELTSYSGRFNKLLLNPAITKNTFS